MLHNFGLFSAHDHVGRLIESCCVETLFTNHVRIISRACCNISHKSSACNELLRGWQFIRWSLYREISAQIKSVHHRPWSVDSYFVSAMRGTESRPEAPTEKSVRK